MAIGPPRFSTPIFRGHVLLSHMNHQSIGGCDTDTQSDDLFA